MFSRSIRFLLLLSGVLVAHAGLASGDAHWGYSGEEGPANWSKLDVAYSTCGSGVNQSPVDLTAMVDGDLPAIDFAYHPGGKEIINNGHTIQVNYAAGSTLRVQGRLFELKQFHFHAPSENVVNGKSYPMEAHLVHADEAGNLAVVALMFEAGAASSELDRAWPLMPARAGGKAALPAAVDVNALLPASREYYRFNGSLTTPPCSEGVLWMVMKTAGTASMAQIEKFAGTIGQPNNRPLQPVNARLIVE